MIPRTAHLDFLMRIIEDDPADLRDPPKREEPDGRKLQRVVPAEQRVAAAEMEERRPPEP